MIARSALIASCLLASCAPSLPSQRPSRGGNGAHVDAHDVPLVVTGAPACAVGAPPRAPGAQGVRRKVERLQPYPTESPGWYTLVLEGPEDASQRGLPIYAPKRAPLSPGQLVELRARRVAVGAIAYDEVVELYAEGQLLAATFTDRAPLEGWALGAPEPRPGVTCSVGVTHGTAKVTVPANEWVRMVAAEGDFALSIVCPRPALRGDRGAPLPNDYVPDSLAVRVVRLPR